jgi:hypothetical protein
MVGNDVELLFCEREDTIVVLGLESTLAQSVLLSKYEVAFGSYVHVHESEATIKGFI